MKKIINFTLFVVFPLINNSVFANILCSNVDDALNDDGCKIVANIPYYGGYGSMHLKVYTNGLGKERFDKPIVVVAPYPSELLSASAITYESVSKYLDQVFYNTFMGETPTNIKNRYGDHDIFLFAYSENYGAGDYIQRNAFALLSGIGLINEKNNYSLSSSVAILGTSLGGLVSKYALSYASDNAIDVNVRTWVTIDSPLRGANIPLSYQYLPPFIVNMINDFGSWGGIGIGSLDFLSLILSPIGLFENLVLAESIDDITDDAIAELERNRSLVQLSYNNIFSVSSKQLLINHVFQFSSDLRRALQGEMDAMTLEKNMRKVVFTNTNLADRFPAPSTWEPRNLIDTIYSDGQGELDATRFDFRENIKGNSDYSYLFLARSEVSRPITDDVHEENVIQLVYYPYFNYVNNVPGTHLRLSTEIKNILNEQIFTGNSAYCVPVSCYEPTFIPSFSSLDIDPNVYGYDLETLKGKSIDELEIASPFDTIYHQITSTGMHGSRFNPINASELEQELKGRHDLAFLIAINSLLM